MQLHGAAGQKEDDKKKGGHEGKGSAFLFPGTGGGVISREYPAPVFPMDAAVTHQMTLRWHNRGHAAATVFFKPTKTRTGHRMKVRVRLLLFTGR